MLELSAYPTLFLTAFAAATLFPIQSEIVLVGLLVAGDQPAWALVVIATLGNVLGAVVNWAFGRYLMHFEDRRWFPVKRPALRRAEGFYDRVGHWSLLLSWAPIIGDPLTVLAGILREPLWRFTALVTAAKGGRYLILTGATLGLI